VNRIRLPLRIRVVRGEQTFRKRVDLVSDAQDDQQQSGADDGDAPGAEG
jgi:hypothetical protein